MMHNNTLLLTGTISPSKEQRYQSSTLSSDIRKIQYLKALIFYITHSNFDKIIFCENSDYKFSESEFNNIEYLSKLYLKKVELLNFKGNYSKVDQLGYGYGEGECLDYAFDNSNILKESKSFYKITGRYIIGNIDLIIDELEGYDNLFMRDIPAFFSMNTGFFKMDCDIYKKYFYNAKKNVNHGKKWQESQSKGNKGERKIVFEVVFYSIIEANNLFKLNGKLKILPKRINYSDDNNKGGTNKYSFMRRPPKRYDFIGWKAGIYIISKYDKLLWKLISFVR